MVAAFGHLDVGEVARGGEHARREVVVKIRLGRGGATGGCSAIAGGDDALQVVGADQRVHFRMFLRISSP